MLVWYLLLAILLTCVDFPISSPVFDSSTYIKGRSQIFAEREAANSDKSS